MGRMDRSTSPAATPRILFVEDEASIAEPFASALRRSGFDPELVGTAAGALSAAQRDPPDLVLLDLNLPDGDGRDVCRALRQDSDVPIVMLTARGTELDRVIGLELGADDYVVKPFSAAEVVARIRAVLRRPRHQPAAPPIRVGDLAIDVAGRRATVAGRGIELSRKEFDLLVRLARDAGRVVTREQLMTDVWDTNWFGSTKTLDVHVGWLRRKLGDGARGGGEAWIETVRGVGYRFRGTDG